MTEYNKSRLAELLGVEEDEQFKIKGCKENVYRIHNGVREVLLPGRWKRMDSEAALTEIINDPSRIIHKPRFSDEEMTVLRAYWGVGNRAIARTPGGRLSAYNFELEWEYDLPSALFPSIQPGESADLEEMFGREDADNG